MDTTAHDLRLLSIGYFIQGGIGICGGFLLVCYMALLGAVFTAAQGDPRNRMPENLPYIIGGVLIAMTLVTLAMGVCMVYAGISLQKRKNRVLVLVMAGLNCLAVPYGTVLGIFTFMVLQRETARAMFGDPAAAPPALQSLS